MYARVCGPRGLGLCSVATIEASVYVGIYLCRVLKPSNSEYSSYVCIRDFLCTKRRQERCSMTTKYYTEYEGGLGFGYHTHPHTNA